MWLRYSDNCVNDDLNSYDLNGHDPNNPEIKNHSIKNSSMKNHCINHSLNSHCIGRRHSSNLEMSKSLMHHHLLLHLLLLVHLQREHQTAAPPTGATTVVVGATVAAIALIEEQTVTILIMGALILAITCPDGSKTEAIEDAVDILISKQPCKGKAAEKSPSLPQLFQKSNQKQALSPLVDFAPPDAKIRPKSIRNS
ncbi:uncharacterized protein TRIVIDRAFT_62790 [Trichoderma virens Gv29-8]|uniref:Uncharacterized protein n=1 Tax=Hypocrea virens (strain Gv29-8 / FGSC 10586) TaxID=413071 RepID=G9MF32_HYPVG|nr:uncharacterized protein TRIVIDRAFT_62790 [Trichoderma virens Gv29-8]EHK26998.1 hypothetical protein TRIVIDRAFT_62790 [Trichoderma virens Gv29-8]